MTITFSNPAFFNTVAASFIVAPLVIVSSTIATHRVVMAVCRTAKAPLTFDLRPATLRVLCFFVLFVQYRTRRLSGIFVARLVAFASIMLAPSPRRIRRFQCIGTGKRQFGRPTSSCSDIRSATNRPSASVRDCCPACFIRTIASRRKPRCGPRLTTASNRFFSRTHATQPF